MSDHHDHHAHPPVRIPRQEQEEASEEITEVARGILRLQLPTDFTGQIMLAEIQAEHLNDLPAAEMIIQRFCQQPNHAPRNIAYALNTLADWHLKISVDPDLAREVYKKLASKVINDYQKKRRSA